MTSGNLIDLVHVFLDNRRHSIIKRIRRLTMLEEMVGVFGHTACHRFHRVQCTGAEIGQRLSIDQRSQILPFKHFDLLNFVRRTETVEEVDERNTRLNRRKMGYTGQVHHFLYGTLGQHGKPRLTGSHHVLMVSENRKCMRSDGTRRYMKYARQ